MPNTEFIIDRWSKSHKEVKKIGFVIPQQSVNADKDDKNVLYETLFMNSTLTFEVLEKNIDNKDWHLTSEEVKKYNIITEDYNMEEVKKLLTEDIWRDKDK